MPNDDTIPTISEIKGNTILQLLTNVYDTLKKAIFKKQNKLVAGDNIVIDEETNTISAIEGGTPVLDNYYTKPQTDALLDEKADIIEVYSKTDVDNLLSEKENIISAGSNITIITDIDNKKTIKLSNDINREGTTNLAGATNVVGNTNITGNVTITGNITQNGEAYETHAEKIYTKDDYIITREGAVGGLASGDYSGLEVEKYNGVDNCRLVVDNEGVARVGDTGDEQALMTRDDTSNLNNNAILKWDGTNNKAITEVTVGSDTKPIKSVNGVLTPITKDLALANWTDVTNDLTKITTAHEILFQAIENNTFLHSMIIPGSRSIAYVGLSAGGNYLNALIQTTGISIISSNGTWTGLSVYIR